MIEEKPLIGITMGDPAGVGPEIILKALIQGRFGGDCSLLIIGDAATLKSAAGIVGFTREIVPVQAGDVGGFDGWGLPVLDLANEHVRSLARGKVHPMAGEAAFRYLDTAIDLALEGTIAALVTAPLNKEALNAAGYNYAGHTEILAERCGSDVTMMLISGCLRVSHVTTHVSLREACELVRRRRILEVIKLTDDALGRLGIKDRCIGVAGLNPHASDGGLFGREETEEIIPAVAEAQGMGFRVEGPIPADTVFYRAIKGSDIGEAPFDAVVAMYHDQGHIPVKLLGLLDGVNLTLGLPIIRTSVDHGTAFDKAGKGTANPGSLIEALKLAIKLVRLDKTEPEEERES